MKFATIILLAAMMTGCVSNVSKYDAFIEASLDAKTGAYEAPAQKLLTNASAYVMMAKDGRYGSKNYPNSGYLLASATTAAVSFHLTRIEQAARVETIEEALSSAREMGLTYVFQPTRSSAIKACLMARTSRPSFSRESLKAQLRTAPSR